MIRAVLCHQCPHADGCHFRTLNPECIASRGLRIALLAVGLLSGALASILLLSVLR